MDPLIIGTPEQFEALRMGLIELGYSVEAICQRTGTDSIFRFKTIAEGRERTEVSDGLDVLVRLLMDGETLAASLLTRFLPAGLLAAMQALGLVRGTKIQPDQLYATAALYPVAGLYVASDRTLPVHGEDPGTLPSDVVYAAITGNTGRFLSALPESPCEDFLDLCSGTGIAALVAGARFARRAWACDLGVRSVHFAEFNCRLNGLENVIAAQGDLYEPVSGETFDCIVAHPPYIPAKEQSLLFRDGGEDGEQILARIIQGLPRHLRRGGEFYCLTVATDREGEDFEQRIRRWLGECQADFDVVLVATQTERRPENLLKAVVNAKGRLGKLGEKSEFLERLKVTAIFYGAVVIRRKTEDRPPATGRTLKAAEAGREAVDWYVRWITASAQPGFDSLLMASRPKPAQRLTLQVTHSVQDGGLVPTDFRLKAGYPFLSDARVAPWVAVVANTCNGVQTGRTIYEEMRAQQVIAPEMPEADFAGYLRLLVTSGFLEISEFPLPSPVPPAGRK